MIKDVWYKVKSVWANLHPLLKVMIAYTLPGSLVCGVIVNRVEPNAGIYISGLWYVVAFWLGCYCERIFPKEKENESC